jgi:diaminopropionate ammonia-lyase
MHIEGKEWASHITCNHAAFAGFLFSKLWIPKKWTREFESRVFVVNSPPVIVGFIFGIQLLNLSRQSRSVSTMAQDGSERKIYVNPAALDWKHNAIVNPQIREFHQKLPDFTETPLIPLDSLAKELGVKKLFVKEESSRAGLPAFKILGASWATYRAMLDATQKSLGISLEDLSAAAREKGIKLFAATDGNHGRAVARMAKTCGLECDILVPSNLDKPTQTLIESEGCRVIIIDGNYDFTVIEAKRQSEVPNGLLIQDTAFEGYTEIAQVSVPFLYTLEAENTI